MNENEALVALAHIPHLGSIKIRLLLQRFGSAVAALDAEPDEVADLPGFGAKMKTIWKSARTSTAWQSDLALAARLGVEVVPFTSPRYPKRLLEIADHPILLYIKGELKGVDQQGIAVVGTRQPTVYGLEMAEKFAKDFARQGVTVVSGLARGIDTAAHRGVLSEGGRTVAVIGSGLADIYPQENRALSEKIATQGALISEFPMATPPDRQNFPQRNRIVSGMTIGTLLIEAPDKSGAMITMEKGAAQGRPLFAIPGRADSDHFRGNHLLIKRGQARLVENVPDVLNSFGSLFSRPTPVKPQISGVALENEEKELLHLLPVEEISIEQIEQQTKLPIRKLNILLMSLVLKRMIREYPGKLYKKVM